MPAKDANVIDLSKRREAKGSQVYECGKCQEQAVILLGDTTIRCGRATPEICGARYAATTYKPTGAKLLRETVHPRTRSKDGVVQYLCGLCGSIHFHIQADGSITCFRTTCRKVSLLRWKWLKDLSKSKGGKKK